MTTLLAANLGDATNFESTLSEEFCLKKFDAREDIFICDAPTMQNVSNLSVGCEIGRFTAINFTNFVSVELTCSDDSQWPDLLFTIVDGLVTEIVRAPPPISIAPAPYQGER